MKTEDQEPNARFTDKVINALNEGTQALTPQTLTQLYDHRRQAVAQLHASHEKSAGFHVIALRQHPALVAVGLAVLVLFAAWWFMHQSSPTVTPLDTGELDIELLTGEVPPQVFADWSLVTQENVEDVCLKDS